MKFHLSLKRVPVNILFLIITVLFIFSLLFSGQKIRLREVKIEESEEIFFAKPIDIESSGSRVFILDSQESTVRIFSPTGKFLGSLGRYGRGPGEFIGSNDMSVSENEVALIDREGRRIQFFDHEGSYRGEFKIGFIAHRLLSLSEDKFIISSLPRVFDKNVFLLHGFNRQGKEIFQAEKVSSSGNGAFDFFLFQHHLVRVNGQPVLFKNFGPELAFFLNENGQRTRVLKIDPALPVIQFQPPLSRPKKVQASFWSVSAYKDRIYLVLQGRMEDGDLGPSRQVAVLNLEGKLEGVIDFPVPVYRLTRIDNRFFIIDDSARLRLFELIEEKF